MKVSCVLPALLFVSSTLAQNPPAPIAPNEPATPNLPAVKPLEVPARPGIAGELSLTLDEVIRKVLDNDPDLVVARLAAQEAVFNVNGAKGYYDPSLGLNAYRLRSVSPVASLIGGSADGKLTQKSLYADPQLTGNFPWLGGTYALDFSSARQSTDSTFTTLNPQFPTSVNLNLTQPLWRGLRFDQNRYRLQVARKNVSLSNEQLRQRVIEIVTQAIQSYWELDYAYRNLTVQIEGVRLAEQQDLSNRRQVKQGILAPVDVIQTQTQISTFQQTVFSAQADLTRAENTLKQLTLAGRQDPAWNMALVPTTALRLEDNVPSLADALQEALGSRPEIAEVQTNIDLNGLDMRLSREQAKPQINALAKLSAVGLSGRELPFVTSPLLQELGLTAGTLPIIFPGGYSQSLSNVAKGVFPSVQLGVQMNLPIRNRTALAQVAVNAAQGKRLAAQQESVEMAVEADVRNTLQALLAARARLGAAESASKFAQEQYLSEQRQFQAGTSSVFLVLQRQTDLVAARSREIRARADVGNALADLDRATAHTLAAQRIDLVDGDKPVRPPQ
jgi:HAE1 family hydrophobic/amphiphilic exporter-1